MAMPKPQEIETRSRYAVFAHVTTRWKDNDVYGHINNAVYNAWIDTAVTQFFRDHWPGLPDTEIIPVAAETLVTFHRPIVHPARVQTGFRVDRIGTSSVTCGVGIFQAAEEQASAWGHMVHVWVDRVTNRAVPMPDEVRRGLEGARAEDSQG